MLLHFFRIDILHRRFMGGYGGKSVRTKQE
jgi:hypothetical protein